MTAETPPFGKKKMAPHTIKPLTFVQTEHCSATFSLPLEGKNFGSSSLLFRRFVNLTQTSAFCVLTNVKQ